MNRVKSIKSYVPAMFAEVEPLQSIYTASGTESGLLFEAIQDILNQMYVETATWGLESWENFFYLPVDKEEPLENRRSRLKTMLRGQGTTTKEMLESVCASFINGEVEVIEHPDDSVFKIKFVGKIGVPSNLDYIRATIDKIKPAHLEYEFIYVYNVYAALEPFTHDHLSGYTYEQLRSEVII